MEDDITSPGPFEGPEKLLEVWFAPSADELPERDEDLAASFVSRRDRELSGNGHGDVNGVAGGSGSGNGHAHGLKQRIRHEGMKEDSEYRGLRKVPREVWEEMLDIVKCKVLSVVQGEDLDAYLLRWVPFCERDPTYHRCVFGSAQLELY
jgi:S-adenosylmethionine decarboxylase